MQDRKIEFGLNSFGEVATDAGGHELTEAETLRLMLSEVVLAESVGVDSFSVGEHYKQGHVDTAGAVLLAAASGQTGRIRLGTSVTVLSTQDPVRLFAEFSTLAAVSHGRAQVILGRASSIESFPLFGYDLGEYETLFEEKLELFTKLLESKPVSWSGTTRSSLTGQRIAPALEPSGLPTWVGVGGSPQSVIRAARFGLPMMLAIIGGAPSRFAPHVDLYLRSLSQFGFAPRPVGQHSLGYVAATDEEAKGTYWPLFKRVMETVGQERGFRVPSREEFEAETSHGAMFVGAPDTIAVRIAESIRALGLSRFDLKYDILGLSVEQRAQSIALYGHEVIPRVHDLLESWEGPAIQTGQEEK